MKVNELEALIRESVKEALSQRPTKRKHSKQTLKESAEFSGGSLGADIALEPKVEHAVTLAAHCAKILTGEIKTSDTQSPLLKCLDDIVNTFLDSEKDFAVPDLNPSDLASQFQNALNQQMVDSSKRTAKVAKAILDKAIDKLNVYRDEFAIVEAGYDQYGESIKKRQ